MIKTGFTAAFFSLLLFPVFSFGQTNLSNNFIISLADADLNGKWHLVMSSAPFWKKKKRSDIVIEYTGSKEKTIDERITYKKDGAEHVLILTDFRSSPSHFTRKFVSGLHPFQEQWYAVAMDANKQWLVIYRVKGLLRRESIDVISHSTSFGGKEKEQFLKLCGENYFLKAKTKHMSDIVNH
jgi:hypothetical protein